MEQTSKLTRTAGITVAALLLWFHAAAAQEYRATMAGRVTDEQAAALPGVTVTATHTDTGTKSETVTAALRHLAVDVPASAARRLQRGGRTLRVRPHAPRAGAARRRTAGAALT